jgi:hypothetical protein
MGFSLLASASAAPATVDQAVTVTDQAGSTDITLTATENNGELTLGTEGAFSIVTAPANGTATIANGTRVNLKTAINGAQSATTATITVDSTANFPSEGYLFIDNGNNVDDTTLGSFTLDADDEVVSYTGKTATTFTGVTRGVGAETDGAALADNTEVHPIAYSTIAVSPSAAASESVNLLDASGFVTPAAADTGTIVFLGGTDEANTYTGKTGNSLTGLDEAAAAAGPKTAHAVGESVIQFGWQIDTGTISYDPNAGFLGADSIVQAYSLVAANRTVSITVISDLPVADDVTANVTATLPVALPTILNFSGTDSSSVAGGSSLQFTTLPQKGLLTSTTPTLTCTDVTGAVLGEVMTNCSAATVYTPLLGATGTDTFTYTITNGGDTSAAATVTVTIGGSTTPTPGAGFSTEIVAGFNISQYNGGTVAQMAADAAAAGATTVSVTVEGGFLTYVVGAPAFVNAAFEANFTDGIPAGTGVLVIVGS